MKKVLFMTMAALTILFTQCKKTELTPATPAAEGGVNITLSVDGGSKLNVTPGAGTVAFTSGDVIYVASNGKYVGYLTHDGTKFAGTISDPAIGQPLFFYFLGNKIPETAPVAGTTTSIAVSIADQSTGLPVISAAESRQNYNSYTTEYTATLLNRCGLVKFSATGYTVSGDITIKKMNNKVTVNLNKNLGSGAFTNTKDDEGLITLKKESDGEYWAILLPQDAVTGGTQGDAYSSDGWIGTYSQIPHVYDNSYFTDGVAVTLKVQFSVSQTTKVTFSPGLMYWDGHSFEFEADQTSYQTSWNASHVNHFSWSKTASVAYSSGYSDDEATGSDVFFTNNPGNASLPNGSFTVNNETGIWRVLTKDERHYLFNTSNESSGARQGNRFAKAMVSSKNGLLIFPDEYTLPNGYTVQGGTGMAIVNDINAEYPTSSIDSNTWTTMQASGVVFLPAAGSRFNTEITSVNSFNDCWLGTSYGSDQAYCMAFNNYYNRKYGLCVRLVR